MHIAPVLAALRADDRPQRAAQAEMAAASQRWAEAEAAVHTQLGWLDAGAALGECPALEALFASGDDAAQAFAAGFVATHAEVLARAPLAHVAHRHFTDGLNSTLLLGRSGLVALTLLAIDGRALAARPDPLSANYPPLECWDRVLAGDATAETITCFPDPGDPASAQLHTTPLALTAGDVLARDARRTALRWRTIPDRVVLLSLQRRTRSAETTREHRLADGHLIHRSAGSPRDSRFGMFVALLGAMQRTDAAPLLAELGQEPGPDSLRWQALREGLGLDTATGFTTLDTVARNAVDPLAGPAATLRAHLLETYPQLESLMPCPA